MYPTLQSLRRQQVNSVQNVPGSTGGWLGRLTGKPAVGRAEDEEPWRQTRDAEGVAAVMTDDLLLNLGRAVAHMVSRRVITAVLVFSLTLVHLRWRKWHWDGLVHLVLFYCCTFLYLSSFHEHSAL